MMKPSSALQGQTMRWKFSDGPTAGKTYEHRFDADGTVTFRDVDDSGKSQSSEENSATSTASEPKAKFASFEIAPDIHLVSYLSGAGYTLTVSLNLQTKEIEGFASNDKQWFPVTDKIVSA